MLYNQVKHELKQNKRSGWVYLLNIFFPANFTSYTKENVFLFLLRDSWFFQRWLFPSLSTPQGVSVLHAASILKDAHKLQNDEEAQSLLHMVQANPETWEKIITGLHAAAGLNTLASIELKGKEELEDLATVLQCIDNTGILTEAHCDALAAHNNLKELAHVLRIAYNCGVLQGKSGPVVFDALVKHTDLGALVNIINLTLPTHMPWNFPSYFQRIVAHREPAVFSSGLEQLAAADALSELHQVGLIQNAQFLFSSKKGRLDWLNVPQEKLDQHYVGRVVKLASECSALDDGGEHLFSKKIKALQADSKAEPTTPSSNPEEPEQFSSLDLH